MSGKDRGPRPGTAERLLSGMGSVPRRPLLVSGAWRTGMLSLCLLAGTSAFAQQGPAHSGNDIPASDLNTPPPSDNRPPMLGIRGGSTSSRVVTLGSDTVQQTEGVKVYHVFPNSAAAAMGIQTGDVITALNGRPVKNMSELAAVVSGSRVGTEAAVVLDRNGQEMALQGEPFRAWPSHIPRTSADWAERRQQAMERRQRAMDRAVRHAGERAYEQVVDLNKQLEQLEQGIADMFGLDSADALLKQVPKLADGSLPTMLPKTLLQLPGWVFKYECDVQAPVDQETDKAKDAAPGGNSQTEQVPDKGALYQFEVSSEYF